MAATTPTPISERARPRPDADLDNFCRLLAGGKHVITTFGYMYPKVYGDDVMRRLTEARDAGGVAFHGTGANPGWFGDLLALLMSGLSLRIDQIGVQKSTSSHPVCVELSVERAAELSPQTPAGSCHRVCVELSAGRVTELLPQTPAEPGTERSRTSDAEATSVCPYTPDRNDHLGVTMSDAEELTVEEPVALADVNFFDPAINDCPYGAYRTLRDESPVWFDERLQGYVITRHDDVHAVLADTGRFVNSRSLNKRSRTMSPKILALYEEKGWVPAPTLAGRDDPNHREMRTLFNHAFRPKRIAQLEPDIRRLADDLIDAFISDGTCDWVGQFAVPLPLVIIGVQMGANPDDIWRIKAWTDAWVQRLGLMQTPEQVVWSTEMEIEAQHYFQPIFDRLRITPDDTLLSDLVNTPIPEWGRCLTNEELHAEMMADTFVGGSETTTNALSGGVRLLIEHPDQWDRLTSDPDTYLPALVEEVLRLESPVQRLTRTAAVDVELHGVTIPAGSSVLIGYAAANRDERVFDEPERFDLDRNDAKKHLTFGFGTHFCMGAPLARRELLFGFEALVRRIDEMWFLPDTDLTIAPNYFLRALRELRIGFRAVDAMAS